MDCNNSTEIRKDDGEVEELQKSSKSYRLLTNEMVSFEETDTWQPLLALFSYDGTAVIGGFR